MTETEFKRKVLEDLKKVDSCWVLKTAERGRHGVPDLLLCLKGQMVAIELKAEEGRTTPLQIHTLKKIKDAGGIAFVSRPSTWNIQYDLLRNTK